MGTTQSTLKAVPTADETDPLEPTVDHPREDCWCAGKDVPCFAHSIEA